MFGGGAGTIDLVPHDGRVAVEVAHLTPARNAPFAANPKTCGFADFGKSRVPGSPLVLKELARLRSESNAAKHSQAAKRWQLCPVGNLNLGCERSWLQNDSHRGVPQSQGRC